MAESIVHQKSLDFSIEISKYFLSLKEKRYYEVASQLFRSATSMGANIRESLGAESRKDFLHKLQIALKESYETIYRGEILKFGFVETVDTYINSAEEIKRILIASIRTLKSKIAV